jgi:hypothetical protein
MEAIREFEIATNQYDVTYGRSGGGSISTVNNIIFSVQFSIALTLLFNSLKEK